MSTIKKTRADSILGTLPEERQAEIADYARTHTIEETRAWLNSDGIKVSAGAFSTWLSSWSLAQRFRSMESQADQFKDWLGKTMPDLSEAELDRRAALMFQFEAVKSSDPETYLAFATARHKGQMDKLKFDQRERQLILDRERFQFDAAKAAKQHAAEIKLISANSKLSESEKIDAIRARLFGSLPEQVSQQ
jgi:hypothetical protein